MKTLCTCLLLASLPLVTTPAHAGFQFVPGLQAAGFVAEDVDGIPHVLAHDEHDMAFLAGWLHARDRQFQMDVLRRQASGTLAELFGPVTLPSDVQFRTLGLRRAAERSWPLLSAPARAALSASSTEARTSPSSPFRCRCSATTCRVTGTRTRWSGPCRVRSSATR